MHQFTDWFFTYSYVQEYEYTAGVVLVRIQFSAGILITVVRYEHIRVGSTLWYPVLHCDYLQTYVYHSKKKKRVTKNENNTLFLRFSVKKSNCWCFCVFLCYFNRASVPVEMYTPDITGGIGTSGILSTILV